MAQRIHNLCARCVGCLYLDASGLQNQYVLSKPLEFKSQRYPNWACADQTAVDHRLIG